MNTINLNEMDLRSISNLEMSEINGGDWNKGFEAGVNHGESAGSGILAGLTVIGIIAFFL
jgi:hypothetical protein